MHGILITIIYVKIRLWPVSMSMVYSSGENVIKYPCMKQHLKLLQAFVPWYLAHSMVEVSFKLFLASFM